MTYNNKNGLWQLFLDHKERAIASATLDIAFEFEKCRGKTYDLTVGEMRHGGWQKPKFQISEIIYKPLL